ncbi:MAG TPA: TIGR03545 family protein [bacterium]|nr:TIGR03545 family protein [bacterium]HPN46160.1 TIGR03545 family protein [bacterium]
MRWKGIITLLVLAGLFIAASLIFTDTWLEKKLEKTGSDIMGARVELNRLDVSLIGLHVRWDSLQVTDAKDTWKNILTTGRSEFDMDFLPLLRKKVLIQNVQLSNITSGTARTTDGKWEKKVKVKKESKPNIFTKTIDRLEQQVAQAPVWDLKQLGKKVNLDSIITILQVKSPAKIDSLFNDINSRYTHWEDTFKKVNPEADFQRIETQIKAIEPAKIKSIEELQASLKTVNTVKADLDSLKKFVTSSKTGLKADLDYSSTNFKMVEDWIKEDYARVQDMAKLPDLNAQNIGKFIFGAQVVNKVNRVLAVTGQVREYSNRLKSDKPKKEKPPRLKGQFIHFSSKGRYPDFWMKKALISGSTLQGLSFSGQVTDIVSEQKFIGKPTLVEINGSRSDGAALHLGGEFNYLESEPRETYKLDLIGMPMNNIKISESPLAPGKLTKGKGQLNSAMTISGDHISGNINFIADALQFEMNKTQDLNKLEKTLQSVYETTSMIDFNAGWVSNNDDTRFTLNSNLDDLITAKFKSILSAEINEAKTKLQAEVNKRVAKHKAEITKLVDEKTRMLSTQMQSYEDKLNSYTQQAENRKKEIEARIEQEKDKQKNKLKDQTKDKLKGVL